MAWRVYAIDDSADLRVLFTQLERFFEKQPADLREQLRENFVYLALAKELAEGEQRRRGMELRPESGHVVHKQNLAARVAREQARCAVCCVMSKCGSGVEVA